mgnify:CR=1 FL=1
MTTQNWQRLYLTIFSLIIYLKFIDYENELTKDNQSPFKSAGAIKSKVAIGVFGWGTKNIKYIKNETLNPPAPRADKKHIGENFSLKSIKTPFNL